MEPIGKKVRTPATTATTAPVQTEKESRVSKADTSTVRRSDRKLATKLFKATQKTLLSRTAEATSQSSRAAS